MKEILKSIKKIIVPKKYDASTIFKEGSQFEVDCWQLSEIVLEKVVPKIGVRPYPLNEQMLMAAAVAFIQPKFIIEWGTHQGKSARLFYEITKTLGLNCKIYSIDSMNPNHPEFPGAARGKYISRTTVKQINGDGAEVARELLENADAPSLIFIDGDHSREATKRDFSLWSKLPPGSGLLAHDVFYQIPSAYNIGPWKSFQELLDEQKLSISQIQWQLLGLPGMVFIKKNKRV